MIVSLSSTTLCLERKRTKYIKQQDSVANYNSYKSYAPPKESPKIVYIYPWFWTCMTYKSYILTILFEPFFDSALIPIHH